MQVEEYQIRYDGDETIDTAGLEDGKVKVEVSMEITKIEARVRYKGYDNWSGWVSSDVPVGSLDIKSLYETTKTFYFQKQESQLLDDLDLPVLIIIGSTSVFLFMLFMSIFVVRKKSSKLKYDFDKVKRNGENSDKLEERYNTRFYTDSPKLWFV